MNSLVPHRVQQLLAAVELRSPFGERDQAMLLLLYFTGLRVGELVGLSVAHVWARGEPRPWLDLPARVCKGGRRRSVPLSPSAQEAVRRLVVFNRRRGFPVGPEAPLLCDRRHRRLPAREVQRVVQKLRERAGLGRVTPHTLRHSFASRLVALETSARVVQKLLGHRWCQTTELYLHTLPEELEAAVRGVAL